MYPLRERHAGLPEAMRAVLSQAEQRGIGVGVSVFSK